jgi:hypothetical protein
MFIKKRVLIAASIATMILPAVAQACSVCFSGDDDAVTHAFNWSVGFLLAAPYVIAGTIAGCLVIAYRKAAAKRAALEEQEASDSLIWTQEESAK